jgi:adenine phosphoribosyltransferase
MDLKAMIRNVPDFPKPGIVFRDITTLIKDGAALAEVAAQLAEHFRAQAPELVIGVESRGFILGTAVALQLGVGFIAARKPGKLPAATLKEEYELEYGADAIEIHTDAITPGQKVLLIDDLIATGGTALAAVKLVEQAGGAVVGCGFLIDLAFLNGTEKLSGYEVYSLIQYDSE